MSNEQLVMSNGRLPRYECYKDSGVEWLGKIPSHWHVYKSKYCFSVNMGQSPDSSDTNDVGKGLPFLQGNAEFDAKHPTPKYFCTKPTKTSKRNDILMSVRAPVGELNIADQTYTIGRGLCALSPIADLITTQYGWYSLHTFREQLKLFSTGSTYDSVSSADVGQIRLFLPPIEEQERIARFLDEKTAEIDAAIAKKERLIALLEEQKAILINTAVTKGLDPAVAMRDSGIDWLGNIPAHWKVKNLWHMIDLEGGSTPSKERTDYWVNGSIPWVSPKDMKRPVLYDSIDHITQLALSETAISLVEPPAILMVIRGMILSHTIPVALTQAPVTINQDMKAMRVTSSDSTAFVALLLKGINQKLLAFIEEAGHGTRRLRTDYLKQIYLAIPPLEEQDAIVSFIKRKSAEINSLKTKNQTLIDLLEEFKSILIANAVTGKIKV